MPYSLAVLNPSDSQPELTPLPPPVEIPDAPLVSEGPALHHPGKSRPKPARMQRGGRGGTVKPALLAEAADETDSSKVEEGPAGGEAGDREKPKAAPLLPPKKPVEEPVKPDQPDLPPPERPPSLSRR